MVFETEPSSGFFGVEMDGEREIEKNGKTDEQKRKKQKQKPTALSDVWHIFFLEFALCLRCF